MTLSSARAAGGANIGERGLALAFLVAGAPLILLIAVGIRVAAGAPVLHRGTRLGRGKQPFTMYKLRTLVLGASQVTGGRLLNHCHSLFIRGGRFLRETRLDELPQLWNIVRGDMGFVGPRPERPEVFETLCREIPGYERRFEVRPGLIGVSQLFTPHGTPKRYRTLIDNGTIRKARAGSHGLGIVAFTVWRVLCEAVRRILRHGRSFLARIGGRYREKRRLRRATPEGARVHLADRAGGLFGAPVIDMNEEALLVRCDREPDLEGPGEFLLDVPVRGVFVPARRTARCRGGVVQVRKTADGPLLLIEYRPCSPRSEYVVQQYFLRGSLAGARRAWRGPVPSLSPPQLAWRAPCKPPPGEEAAAPDAAVPARRRPRAVPAR